MVRESSEKSGYWRTRVSSYLCSVEALRRGNDFQVGRSYRREVGGILARPGRRAVLVVGEEDLVTAAGVVLVHAISLHGFGHDLRFRTEARDIERTFEPCVRARRH